MPRPAVPTPITRQVLHRVREGGDPLGIGDPDMDVMEAGALLRQAAGGVGADVRTRVVEALAALTSDPNIGYMGRPCDIDVATARILAHGGADPLVLSWLARCAGDGAFPLDIGPPTGLMTIRVWDDLASPTTDTSILTEAGLHWWPNGNLVVPLVPETVMAACVGRRLRDVVSHPALDTMDLTIASAQRGGPRFNSTYITVATDSQAASIDELTALSEQARRLNA